MSDSKWKLTTNDTRHLFKHLHDAMKEVYIENSSASSQAQADLEQDPLWQAVDQEFRKAYEMSRYALEVTDLDNYLDPEIFAGNCEDFEGIEPLDENLVAELSRTTLQIADLQERNNQYRRDFPKSIEANFQQHCADFRNLCDQMMNETRVNVPNELNVYDPTPMVNEIQELVQSIKDDAENIKDVKGLIGASQYESSTENTN